MGGFEASSIRFLPFPAVQFSITSGSPAARCAAEKDGEAFGAIPILFAGLRMNMRNLLPARPQRG